MNVYYLSLKPETPCNDYWDYGFVNDFINGNMRQPPGFPEFVKHEVSSLPQDDKAIVLLPARHHAGHEPQVNKELSKIGHVVLFLMGDEEGAFAVEQIDHPSIHIWVQNPHPGRHDAYNKLGTGYPPQSQEILPGLYPNKERDVFFSGQVTHSRREYLKDSLHSAHEWGVDADLNYTEGFIQGFVPNEYYERMVKARVAPAPSGAIIPDSFRAYEALESMCVLMADERDPHGKIDGYWDWIFGEDCPFYKVKEWDNIIGWTKEAGQQWPENIHRQTAWWLRKKREFAYKILEQLNV